MRELVVKHQNYAWGSRGDSAVRALSRANALRHAVATSDDDAVPYAELWCGDHPSGMSSVAPDAHTTGMTLKEYVESDPLRVFGAKSLATFGPSTPFLLKVLSVSKALSVQAHPDKALAQRLHQRDPENYRDDNHKPEMCVAVGAFEGLCGFVRAKELAGRLSRTPELVDVVGADESAAFIHVVEREREHVECDVRMAYKRFFTALMLAESDVVTKCTRALRERLLATTTETLRDEERVFLTLIEQYPDDVGALCAFVLNHVVLENGQALALAANEPHAYIRGECVEVMATSDNVVRAGLTPKFRDVRVLCDMLTYVHGEAAILHPTHVDECSSRYVTPYEEFALDVVRVSPGSSHRPPARDGVSIWIVFAGVGEINGVRCAPGAVLFFTHRECVDIVVSDVDEDFICYAASANI